MGAPLSERILRHLADAIRRTEPGSEPFQHLVLRDAFPPECYAQMLANLPDTRQYGEIQHADARLPNGRSARRKLELRTAWLRKLPAAQREIWTAVANAFTAPEVEAAYKERFAAALELRLHKPARDLKFHPAPLLLRDLGGYKISVHCDSRRKAITTQYYLPADGSQCHLGTAFHTKKGEEFVKLKTLEFAPNTGYAFPVMPDSWHSVEQMRNSDGERNSLMLIFDVDRGPVGELINGAKRLAQDFRARLTPAAL